MLELRDSLDMLVRIKKVIVGRMTEALVPEETFCFFTNGIDRGILLNILMKRKGMEVRWYCVIYVA